MFLVEILVKVLNIDFYKNMHVLFYGMEGLLFFNYSGNTRAHTYITCVQFPNGCDGYTAKGRTFSPHPFTLCVCVKQWKRDLGESDCYI